MSRQVLSRTRPQQFLTQFHLFLLCLMIFFSQSVFACMCLRIWGSNAGDPNAVMKWEFSRSSTIFIGSVDKIETAKPPFFDTERRIYDYVFGKVVTFRVVSSWKGGSELILQVFTGSDGNDCGIDFRFGRTYVVFASRRRVDDQFYADTCGLTEAWGRTPDLIQRLDQIAPRLIIPPEPATFP